MTRTGAIAVAALLALAACGPSTDTRSYSQMGPEQEEAIRNEVLATLRNAYDLSKPEVVDRMIGIYPESGRVVSATGGLVITTRDSVAAAIHSFWNRVGRNMRQPRWIWTHAYVDVLSPTSAVVTATYRVPHYTPTGHPHEIGGAMTEIFQRRGNRWVVIQEHLSDLPIQQADTSVTVMPGMPGMKP
jgi:hypothetical protein